MILFKYLEDKDVFLKFYSKMLAKRLTGGTSASEEMEINMLGKMKAFCGFEYTSKLQRMFSKKKKFTQKNLHTKKKKKRFQKKFYTKKNLSFHIFFFF